MKKIAIVFLAACLLFASSRYVTHASTSVPTALWNLVPTDYMEQIGIFTDPVNHRGYYPYQAYVNNNRIYSDYYFKARFEGSYYLHGSEMYSVNQQYSVAMKRKFGSDPAVSWDIPATDTYFYLDFSNYGSTLTDQAYFYIEATNGVSVSITGSIETYY